MLLQAGAMALGLAATAQAIIVEHWWNISYATANPDGVSSPNILALALTSSFTKDESSVSTGHGRELSVTL